MLHRGERQCDMRSSAKKGNRKRKREVGEMRERIMPQKEKAAERGVWRSISQERWQIHTSVEMAEEGWFYAFHPSPK